MDMQFYQFKIKLLDIEPEIWRRFVVPANITLHGLHDVIQTVMGWDYDHLYLFNIQRKIYTWNPFSDDEFEDELHTNYPLNDLVKRKGAKIYYLYDFGDSWEHELLLENSRYVNPGLDKDCYCLEGERACPPEDIGGLWGYDDYCEMMIDPVKKAKEEEYLGQSIDFDPEHFDLELVNSRLR